jgi:iron-sulfur cluster repair protein YtfE (RIC family)
MQATDFLAQQHRALLALLDSLRDAPVSERSGLLAALQVRLAEHAALEEAHLYPLIRQAGFPEAAEASLQEHAEADAVAARLVRLRPDDPALELLLPLLDQTLREHLDKEEAELFPWALARIEPAALATAGARMLRTSVEQEQRRGPGVVPPPVDEGGLFLEG